MGFWANCKMLFLVHQGGLPNAKQGWFLRIERRDDNLVILKGRRDSAPILATIPLSDIISLTIQRSGQASIGKAAGVLWLVACCLALLVPWLVLLSVAVVRIPA
jgi:hypothetical protein